MSEQYLKDRSWSVDDDEECHLLEDGPSSQLDEMNDDDDGDVWQGMVMLVVAEEEEDDAILMNDGFHHE